jgi:protein SCO1/2
MKKWMIYLGFFVVLLIAFYYFVFRDYDFNASKLAVINANIPAFSFTDQNGRKITQADTDDKVYVSEYFFTTCQGICPKMNANMRRVYDAFKDRKDFLILSHTCMPEVDSVPLLKAYEHRMLAGQLSKRDDGSYAVQKSDSLAPFTNTGVWHFLTGDKTALYDMARKGYMIDNGKPDSSQLIRDQFIHTQFFALVDRYRRVRGIYDGLKEDEVQKLMADIKDLLKEKVSSKRFMNGFSNAPN